MDKLSYQRLEREILLNEDDDIDEISRSFRIKSRLRRVHIKRKIRVKIPRLKRFFRRIKTSLLKSAWSKICERFKESQAHFDEIFAGNYLFLQVNPTTSSSLKYGAADHKYYGRSFVKDYDKKSRINA